MDGIRLLAWLFSVVAHVTVAWLLLLQVVGSANEAGSGSDQFPNRASVGIESVITFGDAAETSAEAETAIPTQAAQEQPEEVKEDTPSAITTTAENPETTVAAQEVPPADEVKAKQQVAAEAVQAAVDQQAASASQSGGLATILSAYYSDMSRGARTPQDKTRNTARWRRRRSLFHRTVRTRHIARDRKELRLPDARQCRARIRRPGFATASSSIRDRVVTTGSPFSVPFNFIVR